MTPMSNDRVDVLCTRAGGLSVGAPTTREEERALALEVRDLRRVARAAVQVIARHGEVSAQLVELAITLAMAGETSIVPKCGCTE